MCLPALRRAKCEWSLWAVNHPRPRLPTVSEDDDDDDLDDDDDEIEDDEDRCF